MSNNIKTTKSERNSVVWTAGYNAGKEKANTVNKELIEALKEAQEKIKRIAFTANSLSLKAFTELHKIDLSYSKYDPIK